ncbi:MAG TPA: M20/M25/M40 family metallo-hydrolase, partial [bacterium]|nr:M20/M25/M40 family metallo-hydrolase [bacterium]
MTAMIDRAQLVDDFLNLVRIDSESGHERAVADWLRPRLVQLGGAVSMDHAAQQTGGDCGNLLAQFPGDDRPALLLSAHMDTVKPGCGIRPVLAGGVIRSGGDTILGADDKTGIAAIMAALRAVPATERPPVDVLLTVSEESGLMGARVADLSALRARAGYALDAEGLVGTVTVAAPAHEHFRIDVQGTAAHAGIAPEQGRNAIRALAQLLAAFPQGQLADDTTANIGFVGGGRAHNIVAPE